MTWMSIDESKDLDTNKLGLIGLVGLVYCGKVMSKRKPNDVSTIQNVLLQFAELYYLAK
jgi:hypothetical protein